MSTEIERRSKARFPLQLDVRYRPRGRTPGPPGFGRTLNISSAGLLIASKDCVPQGTRLQVTLEWPWLLDGVTPIQLTGECLVVRSNGSSFAALLLRHQFRTRRRNAEPSAAVAGPVAHNLKKAANG